MGNNEIPRRSRLDLVTPEEKALYEMVWQIEKLGAHVLLTDVVVLLGRAREKLADWVELNAAQQTLAVDVCPGCAITEGYWLNGVYTVTKVHCLTPRAKEDKNV